MKTCNPIQITAPFEHRLQSVCLTGFQSIAPRFRSAQKDLLNWLVEAHVQASGMARQEMKVLFTRYSTSPDQIAYRSHELADFSHRRRGELQLFDLAGSDLAQKTKFFEERVETIFKRFYPAKEPAPEAIVHVTCTGYASPSGAQRLVSARRWGRQTQVIHAYHMGCYAAHPAIWIASGLGVSDIIHTELCSLHLDPSNQDPAQLVIQSLFADGFVKYQVNSAEAVRQEGKPSLEILSARDEIIPDSTEAMHWSTGPKAFTMTLSKEVPTLLAIALPGFVKSLFEEAGLDWRAEKASTVFAIHPGGPRIIELSQRILDLTPAQVRWSRYILREHGNMSSATLPHIWQKILKDPRLPDGTLIASIGAGPGLTLSGMIFRKQTRQDR